MELTRDDVEFKAGSNRPRPEERSVSAAVAARASAAARTRAGHAGARRPLRVDEAPLGSLDPLVAARGVRAHDRDRGARRRGRRVTTGRT